MSRRRFEGKVCLVTASSTGIGLAICEQFAKEGATVIINSRNKHHVDDAVEKILKSGGKAVGMVCHAGKISDIKKLIEFINEKYGRLDVLVPNAAVSTHFGLSLEMNEEQYDKIFDVNLRGVFFLIKEAQALMQKTKNSNIVLISSIGGYELETGIGIYCVAKTALIAMAKMLSKEMGDIRVNCCAPGLIKTKFSASMWEGREKEVAEAIKVNRLGEVEDIAYGVAYLASEEASYVNGETLVIAGKSSPRL